uniref:uncharacterized protein LOC122605816 n=1 Tax=Erigeron canadensis TaxID=72917 RepID=UPI001CB98C99|nr:uncharacterized protein LOC122605816 [Erigeron canadensis]
MAVSSKLNITKVQVKSISLPSRSHPTTLRIEQELNNAATATVVATSKPSVENIFNGLSQLVEVYKCMDDLLNSSATQVLISREQNTKWVEELIEESIRFLDVCGSIRDMVTQIKEHIVDLHCALRRRKEDSSFETSIAKYISFRKKMKKDVRFLVASLKQVDHMITCGGLVVVDSDNHHLAAVIKAVIRVSETTVSIFESLLMFFSMPSTKPNKWSIVVSKLIHKGMVACEDHQQQQEIVNEFELIDGALQILSKNQSSTKGDKMEVAKCRLERLESRVEGMETRVECVFRQLIRTRASLLNIISQ